MSYCVHCGVRLEESAKHCPLCNTPVVDPSAPSAIPTVKNYPPRTPEQEIRRSKKLIVSLVSILLLVPACICLICDLFSTGRLTWSLYPIGALLLMFITILVPVFTPRQIRGRVSSLTVFVTLSAYLLMVERISQTVGWFLPIVFPALLAACLMITLLIHMKQKDRLNKLTLLAAIFLLPAAETFLVEALCSISETGSIRVFWSLFVFIPCLFISGSLFLINSNRSLREEFRRFVRW